MDKSTTTTDTTTNAQTSSSQSTPNKVFSVVSIPTTSYNSNSNNQQSQRQQQHPLTHSSSRNSSSNSLSAHFPRHAVELPSNALTLEGIVVSRQDKYGFIKTAINDTRYFFHVKDSDGQAALGAKVNFVVAKDLTTGKDIAYNIVTVEQPMVSLRQQQQQRMAAQMMAGGGYMAHQRQQQQQQRQRQQQQPMNGGGMQPAHMMMLMPNGAPVPAFNNTINPLALQAQQQLQQQLLLNQVNQQMNLPIWSGERRLGRVTLLKKEFGFIKQVNPQRDVFFHFSQLTGMPGGRVNIGDDVEFTPGQDREGKLFAAALTPAAPGLVVFDVIEETLRRGHVVDPPSNTRHYGVTAGLLEFLTVPGDASSKVKIPFQGDELVGVIGGGNVPLRKGDHVMFRIATNVAAAEAAKNASNAAAAVLAGRRAVEVTPLMLTGVVVSLSKERQFGFISYEPDPAAMPKEQPSSKDAATATATGTGINNDDEGTEDIEQLSEEEEKKEAKTIDDDDDDTTKASSEGNPSNGTDKEGKDKEEKPAAAASGDEQTQTKSSTTGSTGTSARSRIFFHFKEIIGGIVLKKGDEITFNLHTNARTGDYNAVKVRRAKAEGGYQPYFSSSSTAGRGGGEVNGNSVPSVGGVGGDVSKRVRFKLAGNGGVGGASSSGGGEKATAVPKMPDDKGGRGFAMGRGKGMQGGKKEEEPAAPGVCHGISGDGEKEAGKEEEETAYGYYDDNNEEEEKKEEDKGRENGPDTTKAAEQVVDETLLAKMAALKLAGLPEKAEELLTLSLKRSESSGSLNVAAKEFTPSSMVAAIKKKKK
jgi:cold shock CspA family protein